jgi:putative addiction module component (TIGR02574 family)
LFASKACEDYRADSDVDIEIPQEEMSMAHKVKDIIDEVLTLPANSRAYIAEVLLESLDFEEDFTVSDAWRAEIEKRCQQIDAGEVELIAGDEAMADLRARFS